MDKRSEWEARLKRFERSGLTRQEFCRKEGVSVSGLDNWRLRLKKERRPESGGFIRLDQQAATIELEFPNGIKVRLLPGATSAEVQTVKEALLA